MHYIAIVNLRVIFHERIRYMIILHFPETIFDHNPAIYMFETDYEDFVIALFSQLPATIYYYKISDRLFIHAWLDRDITIKVFSSLKDITKITLFRADKRFAE